jgi:hypothetical protein
MNDLWIAAGRSRIRSLASGDGARRPDGRRFNWASRSPVSCNTLMPYRSMIRAAGQRFTVAW